MENDGDYYVWMIADSRRRPGRLWGFVYRVWGWVEARVPFPRPPGKVTTLMSTSPTAPTMPAGYDRKRLVGFVSNSKHGRPNGRPRK